MDVTRRSFFKPTATAIGATSLATLGFSVEKALADVRVFKLTRTTDVTRGGAGCPLCGFRPVAATVQGDDKVRYLCCGLCAAEWHLTRVQCASCGDAAGVSYYSFETASGEAATAGVKAETCADCRSYLKLFYREQIPAAEPLADDAATLALDLLLGEAGYARGGVNLLVAA